MDAPSQFAKVPMAVRTEGSRGATQSTGGLLFDYFLLAAQEKVISCRATPGINTSSCSDTIALAIKSKPLVHALGAYSPYI